MSGVLHTVPGPRNLRLCKSELGLSDVLPLRLLLGLELVLSLSRSRVRICRHDHGRGEGVRNDVKWSGSAEVGVRKRILGGYPLGGVKLEETLEEVDS